MRRTLFTLIVFTLSPLAAAALSPAQSTVQSTPSQIQALIADGNASAALGQLHGILQAHPDSGPAWYLEAEAQDAAGNEAAARGALQHAEQIAPNLPFADPQKAEALKQHLGLAGHHAGGGASTVFFIIAAFVVLFLLLRLFGRRRYAAPAYRNGFNAPPPMGGGGGQPYGYGPQGGTGVGGTILSGLAAGAGFAVGERAVQDMFGGNRNIDPGQNIDPNDAPSRDDGLNGDQNWGGGNDDDQNNGGFDPGNNW